jgi:hypothetical protein
MRTAKTDSRPGRPSFEDDPRYRFLAESGWFDEAWYRSHAPCPVPDDGDPIVHYLTHGAPAGLAPNPGMAFVQRRAGSDPEVGGASDPFPHVQEPDPRMLKLEVALIRASGLFDAEFYVDGNPEELPQNADPIRHFCRVGWRDLRRPSEDFDVWWYWSQHLDPALEVLNPFVHYVLLGRHAGLSGRPTDVAPRISADLPTNRLPRRVCLFAAYDRDGVVAETTTAYVQELSRFADVYFLADQYLPPSELEKLEPITRGAWGIRHGGYDFGSYSMLARELVGWDLIEKYDELLLVNDSCYLLDPLDQVMDTMAARSCSWWGMQATKGLAITQDRDQVHVDAPVPLATVRDHLLADFEQDPFYDFHVGSYFLGLRGPVIRDQAFRRLLDSVQEQRGKLHIIQKYEIGVTRCLIGGGYCFDTYADSLYPFHPLFSEWYFELLARGFPLLKKYFLYQNHYDVPDLASWKERVRAVYPDAPVEVLERNLMRVAPADRLQRSFSITKDGDRGIRAPEILTDRQFSSRDWASPVFGHWWAFPVSPRSHRLPTSSRAIFDAVRHDPSIRKVVLTRARQVDLDGENVMVVPLESPEGHDALMRCRTVFLDQPHRRVLRVPYSHKLHQVVLVRDGLALQRLGSARAPKPPRRAEEAEANIYDAITTSSDMDQLATLADNYPATYEICWRTGLPSTDLVLRDDAALPDDMAQSQQRLRRQLAGRRLLVFAPGSGRSVGGIAYDFSAAELRDLRTWARHEDAVIGIREREGDKQRAYMRQFEEFALDLSASNYHDREVILRNTDALLTDVDGSALDFLVTGRPVVSFVHDLEDVADELFFDPAHVLPRPVARTFGDLMDQLNSVWDDPSPAEKHRYRRVQRFFFDRIDAENARRVVQQVRQSSLVRGPR